jgi:hypothetical protein
MQETKRMADEANRICQQAQERMQSGFEAASRSFTEANRGVQPLAAEMMEYSKAAFDDTSRTWEQHRRQVDGPSNANSVRLRQEALREPHGRIEEAG